MTRSEHNQPPERPEFEAGPDPDRLFDKLEIRRRRIELEGEDKGEEERKPCRP